MLKLNVDGAVNIDGKQVGAGGIFRNHKGRWIHDFWFYVGATEGDWTELWGLHEGLMIAVRERFCPLIIESNSLKLVQAINKGVGLEANTCADSLAKMRKFAELGLHETTLVPVGLVGLFERDAEGSDSLRRTASNILS
ncbi:Ribonuclease H domain [Dillenia turbinata]|uniref:Ribonuclease H domain n=1 Tax=Dillenia turbinata TaxID=194707 RepID=A0AAN8VSN5_9MAGN